MASASIVIRTTVDAVVGSKVNENLAVETSSLDRSQAFPGFSFYCKRSKTGAGEGLGTRLRNVVQLCGCESHFAFSVCDFEETGRLKWEDLGTRLRNVQ